VTTTTLEAPATSTYRDLVATRAERGASLYGDRHLARLDLLVEHLGDAAACAVRIDIEGHRWQLRCPHLAGHVDALRALRRRVHAFGVTSESSCRSLNGGMVPFTALYDHAMADLAARIPPGSVIVDGESFTAALDHLADAQVMALLEADRRQRCRRSARPDGRGRCPQQVLDGLVAELEIGLDLVALRDAIT